MRPPMMMPRSDPAPMARPHAAYKGHLLDALRQLAPDTVLDVGCGSGDLLAALQAAGVNAVGVEPEPVARGLAHGRGLDVHAAGAEALPFANGAFDVVVLDYVAHHLAALPRALREAVRVARRAVLILDPWYDDGLPSQLVARAFDDWTKRLDRRQGYVHNPCPTAADLAALLTAIADLEVTYAYHLRLTALPLAPLETSARERLSDLGSEPGLARDLEALLDQGRLHGISDDGCVLVRAERRSPPSG